MMDREELAARIFAVSCYKGGQPCADSFAQADKFLAYAAKQREKGKPQDHDCDGYKCEHPSHYPEKCEHVWYRDYGYDPQGYSECDRCSKCGTPKVKPEPPKPERVARIWAAYRHENGTITLHDPGSVFIEYVGRKAPLFMCNVREILPEDEK